MFQENSLPPVSVEQSKIDALCVRVLLKRARQGASLAPFPTLFLCWLVSDVVSMPLILGWAILNLTPNLASFLVSSRLLKHPPPDERMPYWHTWQIFFRPIQGLCWGVAAIFFHVEGADSFVNDLGVLIVLIAVSAVSIVNMAPSFRTLLGYSSAILLVPAGYYFWLGDAQHIMFAVGLILLWAVELEVGRDAFRQFADGLRWGVINQEISKQLELRNHQLDELNQRLSTMAIRDKLTGLYNRHFIVEQLERQHDLFVRYGTACSIVLLDIDHFKQVNDRHGHAVGDDVLVAFSRRVETELRQGDIFARYGGEEFMLVLAGTDQAAALHLANRIRSTIAGAPLLDQPMPLDITASFGVAQISSAETVEDWLNRADQALYRAKANGRNCVMA
jgi:diguanylate cyclase (GGDEF)-like protein